MDIEPTKLAWAAGIIDGEGCVALSINRSRKTRYTLVVSVTNTDPKMVKALQAMFGGSIRLSRWKGDLPHWKPKWMWVLTSEKAHKMLTAIMPYLLTKRDQAELGLLFKGMRRQRGGDISKPIPGNAELLEKQAWLSRQLADMKKVIEPMEVHNG